MVQARAIVVDMEEGVINEMLKVIWSFEQAIWVGLQMIGLEVQACYELQSIALV